MANGGLLPITNLGFTKRKLNSNPNESENPSVSDLQKILPTTFGFELGHIPNRLQME